MLREVCKVEMMKAEATTHFSLPTAGVDMKKHRVSADAYKLLINAAKKGQKVSDVLDRLLDEGQYSCGTKDLVNMTKKGRERIKQLTQQVPDDYKIKIGREWRFKPSVVDFINSLPDGRGRPPQGPDEIQKKIDALEKLKNERLKG